MGKFSRIMAAAAFAGIAATAAQAEVKNLAMIAYWGETPSTYGGQIPWGSYVVVNPNSGAQGLTQASIANWQATIANIRAQGGKVLGYIPTGYNYNTEPELARYRAIPDQILAYQVDLKGVDGYFFDEAAFDDAGIDEDTACTATAEKFNAIRGMLAEARTGGTFVWNTGWTGKSACFVAAAIDNEHVVIKESDHEEYQRSATYLNGDVKNLAAALNIRTWLLLHSTKRKDMLSVLEESEADYAFITSMNHDPAQEWGGPIWNYTPSYWGNEKKTGSERWCVDRLRKGKGC